jgi:hypothetical protein
MQIANHFRSGRRPEFGLIALSAFVALVFAAYSFGAISFFPPKLTGRNLQIAGAASHVLVVAPVASPKSAGASDSDALTVRADLLAKLMASQPVLDRVVRRTGVPPNRIAAVSPITDDVPTVLKEPDSEARANEILLSTRTYRLDIQAKPTGPIIDVYAQAPTPAEAQRLALAATDGLRDYLRALAIRDGVAPGHQVSLRQLGQPHGAVINGGAGIQIAALTFLVAFALCCSVSLLVLRARRGRTAWDPAAWDPAHHDPPYGQGSSGWVRVPRLPRGILALSGATTTSGQIALPHPPPPWREVATAHLGKMRELATREGNWPRTTRVLPWMIAAFMAMLWLVPFNVIQLTTSLPFDMKLDRLVLPIIAATWLLSVAAGGRGAPRLRLTWIHAAVGGFVLLACLSVVLDAPYLNQTLELDLSIKKLTLLVSYLSFFVVVASVVRRTEVRAFLKYTLVLAVICAIGTIVEYRFKYNVFYDLSHKLLPGFFKVGLPDSAVGSAVDDLGRHNVTGPGELGLEVVAMLTMALPIALVGLLQATRWRSRILYGLAACLLIAAAISTNRKSGLIIPLSVGLTIACFRPREIVKLVPLLAVLVVAIHVLSPGALGTVTGQLNANRLGVNTVSDRTSDYDAIRPDVWTHPALGRGFGSYDHASYRILDSDFLGRLVDMGILGLAAYVLMMVSVIATARPLIRSRHPTWAPMALACAAAAVAALVAAALFDVFSFPHGPYIFVTFAGFLAAIVTQSRVES